jgi:hypothetical protein
MNKNFYHILGVSQGASEKVIENAYKCLAKKFHPDLHDENIRNWAEDRMKEINVAYDTLKDPIKRENYNTSLLVNAKTNKTFMEKATNSDVPRQKVKANVLRISEILRKYCVPMVSSVIFGILTIIFILNIKSYKPEIKSIAINQNVRGSKIQAASIYGEDSNSFTVGSSKDTVTKVMGMPDSIYLFSWSYGSSMVYFNSENKVEGWAIVDRPLKVRMRDKQKNAKSFTVGSTKEDVVRVMGTPTSVFPYSWSYGASTVNFDNEGKVKSWSIVDKPLKVKPENG